MNEAEPKRVTKMEILIPIGILVVWLFLQAVVLPRLGVPT